MRFRRSLWLALLLPQFALLLLFVYDDLRELRYEMNFYSPRPMTECLSFPPFSPLQFVWELFGMAAITGLCGRQGWARYCYTVFAIGLVGTLLPDLIHPPLGGGSILVIPAAVLLTVTLCFVRSPRQVPLRTLSSSVK